MSELPGSPGEWLNFFTKILQDRGVDPAMFGMPPAAQKPAGDTYPQPAIDEIATLTAKNADLRRNIDHTLELLNGKNHELTAVQGENQSLRAHIAALQELAESRRELADTKGTLASRLQDELRRLRTEQLTIPPEVS